MAFQGCHTQRLQIMAVLKMKIACAGNQVFSHNNEFYSELGIWVETEKKNDRK